MSEQIKYPYIYDNSVYELEEDLYFRCQYNRQLYKYLKGDKICISGTHWDGDFHYVIKKMYSSESSIYVGCISFQLSKKRLCYKETFENFKYGHFKITDNSIIINNDIVFPINEESIKALMEIKCY